MVVDCVLGVDLGGSMTRALVADLDGHRVGFGTAGGGNPVSRGIEETARSLRAAVGEALATISPDRIVHAVLGFAGANTFGDAVDTAIADVWQTVGLTCPRVLRPDAEIAFAAGTAESDGFVLVAGTGAVAGHVRDARLVMSVDGHGWLLGDRGSGYWLGREAVCAALAAGEGGASTELRAAVAHALGVHAAEPASAVITRAVYQRPPIALAELAPLVTMAATRGDAVARTIMDRAADLLLESLRTVHRQAGRPLRLPVVTGGGVIGAYGPLRVALHEGISELGLTPCAAQPSTVGAVALAIRSMTRAPLHATTRATLLALPD